MSAVTITPSADLAPILMQHHMERLVRFIRDHGHVAYLRDEQIVAVANYSGASGVSFASVETIEPTLAAVRDWLGY